MARRSTNIPQFISSIRAAYPDKDTFTIAEMKKKCRLLAFLCPMKCGSVALKVRAPGNCPLRFLKNGTMPE